jgi:hypothetical protein
MNSILSPCLRKFTLVFMDDILVYSPKLPEHARHLAAVLQLLQDNQFFVKPLKCSFAQTELEYLGHIVSADSVATDPRKTQAMHSWRRPTIITELHGFLGLTCYYRKFVKGYGIIAKPLSNLLKKKEYSWNPEAHATFLQLKEAMVSTPILALPNF